MKNWIELVEIPSADFSRAVKFYEAVFGVKLTVCDECETEKMAFFSDFSVKPNVAVSWADGFRPSKDGVLVHFPVDDIDATLQLVLSNGGGIVRPKTKIEAEGMGYFALFTDSEGNTLGLYAGE